MVTWGHVTSLTYQVVQQGAHEGLCGQVLLEPGVLPDQQKTVIRGTYCHLSRREQGC